MSALREVWEQIPDVQCKGLCEHSCTNVGLGFNTETSRCAKLLEGRCSGYAERPTVCRLWGAVPEMPCPHGCEQTLTSVEGMIIMMKSKVLERRR